MEYARKNAEQSFEPGLRGVTLLSFAHKIWGPIDSVLRLSSARAKRLDGECIATISSANSEPLRLVAIRTDGDDSISARSMAESADAAALPLSLDALVTLFRPEQTRV